MTPTFIEVMGGFVTVASGPAEIHVIDWDALKFDIVASWEGLSFEARRYLARTHEDEYVELVARYNRAKDGR